MTGSGASVVLLRERIAGPGVTVVADVHDGLSVRLADLHGFGAMLLTGSAAAATLAGAPDGGVPLEDVVALAGRLAALTATPLLVDLDDLGAGARSDVRIGQLAARAGVAGIMVDDLDRARQRVLPDAAVAARLGAARSDVGDDLVVVARTELARFGGVVGVADRLALFEASGADVGFPAAVPGLARTTAALRDWSGGLPLLAVVEDPDSHSVARLGVRLAMATPTAFLAGAATLDRAYQQALSGSVGGRPPAFTWHQLEALLAEVDDQRFD